MVAEAGSRRIGLAAAAPAAHGQHREAFACVQVRDDFARLLEADVDLHRQTCRAETAVVAREHTAHGGRDALRSVFGTQTRCAQPVETALVQSLVGETPRERLARAQLVTADRADFGSRARLHVREGGRSNSRWAHTHSMSNADASQSSVAEILCNGQHRHRVL